MQDFIERLMQILSNQGEPDEMQEAIRNRNEALLDNAFPDGAEAYGKMRKQQAEADPELEQRLFGNPYRNAFNALFR